MNFAQVHLMLNHLPVFGVGFALLVLLAGIIVRSWGAAAVGLVTFILSAAVAIVVYLTGEPAEKAVEGLPGVTEAIISRHETAAMVSLALVIFCGILAFGALVFSKRQSVRVPSIFVIATLIFGLLTATSMAWTATLGGEIRHTEIRQGSAVYPSATQPHGGATRRDDDD